MKALSLPTVPLVLIRAGIWTHRVSLQSPGKGRQGEDQICAPTKSPVVHLFPFIYRQNWKTTKGRDTNITFCWINWGRMEVRKSACILLLCGNPRWAGTQTPALPLPEPPFKSLDPALLSPAQSGLNWPFTSVWIGFPKALEEKCKKSVSFPIGSENIFLYLNLPLLLMPFDACT